MFYPSEAHEVVAVEEELAEEPNTLRQVIDDSDRSETKLQFAEIQSFPFL